MSTLTENQTILLSAVFEAPRTTAQLADMNNHHGYVFGENAARAAMSRMEKRGLVSGAGHGVHREWTAIDTPAREALGLPSLDLTRDSGLRSYVVLEEVELTKLTADPNSAGMVYVKVAEVTGRNTEHAYRQAAKDVYGDGADSSPVLVAIAEKQFRPTTVRVQTRQTVSLG